MEELKVIDKRHEDQPEKALTVQDNSANAVLIMAMEKNYTPELIEKMMDLNDRHEKTEARKAYFEAISAFKENPPEVLKDKENIQFSKGGKKAMYVSLGNLLKTVNPALGKHGLSVSFEIKQAEKLVTVSCKLSHRMGHSETVTMEAPPDISGGNAKNPIQQIKSTVTYLRAATFEAVTGLAATDDANFDDDGNAAGTEYITDKQKSTLVDMMNTFESPFEKVESRFLKTMQIESLDKLPESKFDAAVKKLTPKERKPGEDG